MLLVSWADMRQASKISRLGLEMGIEIATSAGIISFTSIRDCDQLIAYLRLLTEASRRAHKSFGFVAKDDIEVVKRLTVLKAPHVFEDVIESDLHSIITMLKSAEVISEYYARCGLKDVIVSGWAKTRDGLTKSVHYTQAMFQPLQVSSTYTIMKSGDSLVFEVVSQYARPSAPRLLQMNLQCFFTQDGEKTKLRFAYLLDYTVESWDKEFINAAVTRQAKMLYAFLKAQMNHEQFNEADYAEPWKQHQPYVLTILGLLAVFTAMRVLKKDANWYGYLFGAVFLFLFFSG
jgi:hypothetical protein